MKQWTRIEEVFAQALELDPAERPAFLDQACGSEEALRQEVESLLTHCAGLSPTFLDQPLGVAAGLVPPPPPATGDVVGSYRLIDRIGQGGMGTVYLGERADGAFDRRVAVKVLRRGMENDTARLRFELERQILAGLDHPAIARLLDGGTTPAGSPFVVMELVEGQPIDRFCDDRELSVEQRVSLVLEVCGAVASAHRSLIVHRDIKPSNVLVDAEGQPKLLDFGIAKILQPDEPLGANETTTWQRLLTPSWASPEQVRGDRITVATDVYLLGILLYKLLTGRLPHRFSNASLLEAEVQLANERPKPPSRALQAIAEQDTDDSTPPPVGVTSIDPDLDVIALKALRSEAEERYASVDELADDLRRYLSGHPIRARAGNRRYLAKKFVQRHWRALSLAAAAVALLALFAIDRTLQVAERDRVLESREVFWNFVADLFWSADPRTAKGLDITTLEVLARGQAKIDRGQVASPEVEASILSLFGRIHYGLGNFAQARTSLEQAIARFESLEELDRFTRVHELRARGTLGLAWLYDLDSRADTVSEEVLQEELAALLEQATRANQDSRWLETSDPSLALELSSPLAEIYCLIEDWNEATPLIDEAMVLIQRAGDQRTLAIADALGRRALTLKNLEGDLEGAQDLYTQALAIYLEVEGPIHPDTANLYHQLGLIAHQLGDLGTAISWHQKALASRHQLFPSPRGHSSIRRSLAYLAGIYREQGDLAQSASFYQQAAVASEAFHGTQGIWTVRMQLLQAEVLIEAGRAEEAEVLLRAQLDPEHRKARAPNEPWIVHWAEGLLGAALVSQGNPEGGPQLLQSLERLRDAPESAKDALEWLERFATDKKVVPE